MGESKRRQAALGNDYGKTKASSWLNPNKQQREKLITWTIEGLVISLVSLLLLWLSFRFS